MPLLKRVVSPVHVSRVPLVEEWVTDENGRVFQALLPATDQPQDLEAFTNLTLANLVTQLSSLSRHAEELFGELIADSSALLDRTVSLQGRVDKLSVKVTILDSNVEEVSLQDIHMRKAFKSSTMFDQQVVSQDTIPTGILETYQMCERPPPLHELNPYRDDGKDGLKFYTDPSYFFNLWREEMTRETERLKHDKKPKHAHSGDHRSEPNKPKGENRQKKPKVRQAGNTRERQRQMAIAHGEYIGPEYRAPANQVNQQIYEQSNVDGRPMRPNSIELRGPCEQGGLEGYGGQGPVPAHTYSPTHEGEIPQHFPQQPFQDQAYQDHYTSYPQPTYTPEGGGTPSRSSAQRSVAGRPSQPPPAPPSGTNTPTPPGSSHNGTPTRVRGPSQGRESLPPPPPPPEAKDATQVSQVPQGNGGPAAVRGSSMSPVPSRQISSPHMGQRQVSSSQEPDLPPPPPTPDKVPTEPEPPPPTPPPPPPIPTLATGPAAPPPPPPPPFPHTLNGSEPGAIPMPAMPNGVIKQPVIKVEPKPKKTIPVETDSRSDLLEAIRQGIKLRKVEDIKTKPKEEPEADVASILQRRFAFEMSDSESSSDSEYDSDEWDETSA
ncbi:wiskott-Aldrich syndrome protein family member 3 SCAR isoform X2 [Oratosquilla oratoria]|uniref:wiskott-Aldrich syndrome protein family member 3 SCAR isoform X2 n=1 Tax=Oratosquilla oratoria TaxID=337810 RepID=UPI003F76E26D